jgi:hypothetical protein
LDKFSPESQQNPAIERYKKATAAGEPVSWDIIRDLKASGHAQLAEEARRQLADHGNLRAKSASAVSGFAGLFSWLSPAAWTRRKIRRMRVPGTVFDVGPWGIEGWYAAMQKEIGGTLHMMIAALATFAILGAVIIVMPDWSYGVFNATLLKLALFAAWVSYPLRAVWHWEAARIYAAEWDALEAHGPNWHFENSGWFRCVFKRLDGSYKIDPRTRQQRLDEEIAAVRSRGHQTVEAVKGALAAIVKGGVLYAVFYVAVGLAAEYSDQPWVLAWNLPLIVTAWYAGKALPAPLSEWLKLTIDRRCYEKGKQFIPHSRVFDPVHEPLTLETVKAQATLGDGAFVSPRDASRKLGS